MITREYKELRRLRNQRYRDKIKASDQVSDNTILALIGCGHSSRLWPVYTWDTSTPVYHVPSTPEEAFDMVLETEPSVTKAVFNRVVSDYRVAFTLPQARKYLDDAIGEHYAKRRDRKVQAHT